MGRTFIITGTGRGLGEAFVNLLMEEKDTTIFAVSRKITEAQKNYPQGKFTFYPIDFESHSISMIFEDMKKRIHDDEIFFISNAGVIDPVDSVDQIQEVEMEKSIAVNLKPAMLMTNFLLNHFNDRKLTFVNISSGAAKRPIRNWSLYCSSKAFNEMFFDVAQAEFPQHAFHNINPGVMDTDMQKTIRSANFPDVENFKELKAQGQLKQPIEVAESILKTVL